MDTGARELQFHRRLCVLVYWVAIAFGLLNYGANDPLTVAFEASIVYVLLPLSVLFLSLPHHTKSFITLCMFLLVLFFAWVELQGNYFVGSVFSHPAWRELSDVLPDISPVISVSPGDDVGAFLKIALPLGVLVSGLILFDTDEAAMKALRGVAIAGGIVAALSIAQFTVFPHSLLLGTKQNYLDSLTGVFTNRNTAATSFGIITVLLISVTWKSVSQTPFDLLTLALSTNARLPRGPVRKAQGTAFYACLLAVSTVALLLTNSRAGIASTFVSSLFLITLLAMTHNPERKRSGSTWKRLAIAGMLCIAFGFAFLTIAGRALQRVAVRGLDDDRFCVMPGIVKGMRDHWPFGSGLSGFSAIFPAYRDPACGLQGMWDRAHNVYLEGLFSTGMLFPLTATVLIAALVIAFITGIRRRREYRFCGSVGLALLLLTVAHSAIDFSLQIPGFAMLLAATLAPLVTLSLRPPGGGRHMFSQPQLDSEPQMRVFA